MPSTHYLFIYTGTPEGVAQATKVLKFFNAAKSWLGRMGVKIEVSRVTQAQLANPRLVEAFRKKGVTEFPAAKTPNRLFLGVDQITRSYADVIDNFKESTFVKARPAPPSLSALAASGADLHREFYKDELTMGAAERDTGEDVLGDPGSKQMMSRFHEIATRRTEKDQSRTKRTGAFVDGAAPAPPPARTRTGALSERGAMDDIIAKASGPVTQDTLDRAFADDGENANAREDIMMRAFWTNQSETILP